MSKADEELRGYESVLVVKTSIGDVPLWKFIERFLWITNKEAEIVRFILNDEQIGLYKDMCEQKRSGRPIRIDILKARQIGFSTFIGAVIFCMTIFSPNKTAVIVADIAEHATTLFNKYKFFYERLPKELQLPKLNSNAKELVVNYGNGVTSTIRIVVQGDSAGRGSTCQFLHCSECAFWENLEDTLTSLQQTVSLNNLDSMIFLETTGNGFNEYKDVWDADLTSSTVKATFYPWWGNKDYVIKGRVIEPLYEWEQKLMDDLNLSMEQIAWYRSQYELARGNLDKLRQEYPSTPLEAFINSGESVFDSGLVQRRKLELYSEVRKIPFEGRFSYVTRYSEDGAKIDISEMKLIPSKDGDLKIYEEVIEGHPYIVNCDPAMGGKDYYAIQVFDNYTGHQVAVFHKNQTSDDEVAFTMVCLGYHYNTAMICSETNTTAYLLVVANKCGYPFIYQYTDVEDLTNRVVQKLGYKTKTTNRNQMIAMFREAFRDNYKMINDYETICEMENFQIVRDKSDPTKGKAKAVGSNHDDLVMSLAGIFLIRDAQAYIPAKPKPRGDKYYYDEFAQCRKQLRKEQEEVEDVFSIYG